MVPVRNYEITTANEITVLGNPISNSNPKQYPNLYTVRVQ